MTPSQAGNASGTPRAPRNQGPLRDHSGGVPQGNQQGPRGAARLIGHLSLTLAPGSRWHPVLLGKPSGLPDCSPASFSPFWGLLSAWPSVQYCSLCGPPQLSQAPALPASALEPHKPAASLMALLVLGQMSTHVPPPQDPVFGLLPALYRCMNTELNNGHR